MGSQKSKHSRHGHGTSSNHHHNTHHPDQHPRPTRESAQNSLMRVYNKNEERLPTHVNPDEQHLSVFHWMDPAHHPVVYRHTGTLTHIQSPLTITRILVLPHQKIGLICLNCGQNTILLCPRITTHA